MCRKSVRRIARHKEGSSYVDLCFTRGEKKVLEFPFLKITLRLNGIRLCLSVSSDHELLENRFCLLKKSFYPKLLTPCLLNKC